MSKAQKHSKVILTKCSDYSSVNVSAALKRHFELLGGLSKFVKPSDSVLLKPNFIVPKSRKNAAQTDPAVVIETAKLLLDFGAKPFVADSPAWSNTFNCVKKLKLDAPLKKLGVPVKQLDSPRKILIANKKVSISSLALDADVIINLPKLKAHQQLTATFAVKNMFGAVAGKQKPYWHLAKGKTKGGFAEFLIEIYRFLNPSLTIVDAVTAMQGPGPINGSPRQLGVILGSIDPVACETVCAQLINLAPADVPVIRAAKKMAFGCCDLNNITIEGDNINDCICTDFVIPPQIPVKFSLLRVCKSIAKQIFLLAKSIPKNKKLHGNG